MIGVDGSEESPVSLIMHVDSEKHGKKDIVKVEDIFLSRDVIDNISIVAPSATINIVRDYKIVEKTQVEVPESLRGVIQCPNKGCITNGEEEAVSEFTLWNRDPVVYTCNYCDRLVEEDAFPSLLES